MNDKEKVEEARQRVGSKLKEARRQQGLSLEDAEKVTKISSSHLAALERGDFDALPSSDWTQELLARYSWHLKLNDEAMVREVMEPQEMRDQLPPSAEKRSPTRRWLWLAAAILIAIAMIIIVISLMISAPEQFVGNKPQRVVILGLSSGSAPGEGNVLVAKVAKKDLGLLSVPRNTLTEIPGGYGDGDIGRAGKLGGLDLTRRTVVRLTGIKIPYYLAISPEGIKKIVDTMGGVRINVEKPVSIRAWREGPLITLEPGPHTLHGSEALMYLQGKDLQSEAERTRRQEAFLYTMFRQALGPLNLLSNPSTLNVVFKHTETNMSIVEVVELAGRTRAAKSSGVPVSMGMIPGKDETLYSKRNDEQVTYWVPDDKKLRSVVKKTIQ